MPQRDMIRNPYQLRALYDEVQKLDGVGEVYSFLPSGDPESPAYLYLIPQIAEWAQQNCGAISLQVGRKTAERLIEARGIDMGAAKHAVVMRGLRTGQEGKDPVLIVNWPDEESQVIIDGNHRLAVWGMEAEQVVPAYMIDQQDLINAGLCAPMSRRLHNQLNAKWEDH